MMWSNHTTSAADLAVPHGTRTVHLLNGRASNVERKKTRGMQREEKRRELWSFVAIIEQYLRKLWQKQHFHSKINQKIYFSVSYFNMGWPLPSLPGNPVAYRMYHLCLNGLLKAQHPGIFYCIAISNSTVTIHVTETSVLLYRWRPILVSFSMI